MRKWLVVGVSVFIILLLGGAVYAANPIKIFINGKLIQSDVAPFVKDGRTMVPLRVVSESLGAQVEWDGQTSTIYIDSVSEVPQINVNAQSTTIRNLVLMSGDDDFKDKVYLGNLSSNKYSTDSVFNQYGTYGNKYNSKSIWNEYGTYGSKHSSKSAFNSLALYPPEIIAVTDYGWFKIGYVTLNTTKSTAVSPYVLYDFLVNGGY